MLCVSLAAFMIILDVALCIVKDPVPEDQALSSPLKRACHDKCEGGITGGVWNHIAQAGTNRIRVLFSTV
jgi:hypothetical protein